MVSKRILTMKEIVEDYDKIWKCIPLDVTEYKPDYSKPIIIRKAEAVAQMCDTIGTPHMEGSRLAGLGSFVFAPPPGYLSEDELNELRSYPENVSEEIITALEEKIFCIAPYMPGHIAVSQEFILENGVNGMIRILEERLTDTTLDQKQKDFLYASIIEWKGCLRYAERYSEFYMEMAEKEENPELKAEYTAISKRIEKVPANPSESFAEALQSLWFVYRCLHMEDSSGHTFGSLDQVLYSYYRKDIDNGVLTQDDARDYFYDFWLKFCAAHSIFEKGGDPSMKAAFPFEVGEPSYRNGLFWSAGMYVATARHVDDGYPINVAGVDIDGNDLTNELSWMIIEAVRDLRTFSVKPVVKYSEKTNKDFMNLCYEILMDGRSLPSIAYDYNTREALRLEPDNHYTEEDLLKFCNIGCIETAIAGKSFIDAMNCFMNLPKIMQITVNNGYVGDRLVGLVLEEPEAFEDMKNNFSKQLEYFIGLYTQAQNGAAPFFNQYFMRPMSSTLMEGCIERAMLLDDGGCTYWCKSMNCCGIADVADSLMGLKQVVYDEKKVSLSALRNILNRDFEGNEAFRQYLINQVPKYGNGDKEVDMLAKFVVDEYCKYVSATKTFNGNYFRPGMYSFYGSAVNLSETTGSLPSGRKRGEVLSLNVAPEHGAVKNGLTAMLESVTTIDHLKGVNACPVDIQLTPDTPVAVLDTANKYLNENNALLLQVTVVNKEDLIEAQKTPEKYQDLVVRVSGFSARFVVLDKEVQNEIIMRDWTA